MIIQPQLEFPKDIFPLAIHGLTHTTDTLTHQPNVWLNIGKGYSDKISLSGIGNLARIEMRMRDVLSPRNIAHVGISTLAGLIHPALGVTVLAMGAEARSDGCIELGQFNEPTPSASTEASEDEEG
jgi:hypothetical protein